MMGTSSKTNSFYSLHSSNCSLVIDCRGNAPAILYWGSRLSDATNFEMLSLLSTPQELPAFPQEQAPIALSPEGAAGFEGSPGIQVHREGYQWGIFSQIESVSVESNRITFASSCSGSEIQITHCLKLDSDNDVLSATTRITNTGASRLCLERCDAPCIPIPTHYTKILGFNGRWGNEFQLQSLNRFKGAYLRENRSGRTSHSSFPGVIVHSEHANESSGDAYGLHLGWSGNHHVRVEELSSGRSYAQLGELFLPGEMQLEPEESYTSPILYGVSSQIGLSAMSTSFHQFVRAHLIHKKVSHKERPVHFNTWEAMYFDLSLERLCSLADKASEIGIERFVLDDGWFKNRKTDQSGLGDWYVDKSIFPSGLMPLIDHVHAYKMEFGLWVEPEMVNPDSDLYRTHPDWVLKIPSAPLLLSRNQLVLDLTRDEVQSYLFARLNDLLNEYPINYLKWDMNRAIHQPGDQRGRAVGHEQTIGVYRLLGRIRDAHPDVEIESCSSGGGRADFGILAHTDRIWTSDNNDALDRLGIQRGFSMFFPSEVMGSHVGPNVCHLTDRQISMDTRVGVSMFGHMGVEANLFELDDNQIKALKAGIELHKEHRGLIHGGTLVRLDTDTVEHSFGIVASDKREAIFSYTQIDSLQNSVGGRLLFVGLDKDRIYSICVIWPEQPQSYSKSILDLINGSQISGEALMNAGVQLPIMKPANLLVFHLLCVD